MSKKYDRKLNIQFKTDVCIKIKNPDAFIQAISHCLSARFIGLSEVKYISRKQDYSSQDDDHPAIIKDPKYTNQKEVRAIWRPLSPNIEACIIELPVQDIHIYCERRLSLIETSLLYLKNTINFFLSYF